MSGGWVLPVVLGIAGSVLFVDLLSARKSNVRIAEQILLNRADIDIANEHHEACLSKVDQKSKLIKEKDVRIQDQENILIKVYKENEYKQTVISDLEGKLKKAKADKQVLEDRFQTLKKELDDKILAKARRDEEEKAKKEEEEKKKREEEERKKKEEEERAKKEEEDRLKKENEEKEKSEAERLQKEKEEQERKLEAEELAKKSLNNEDEGNIVESEDNNIEEGTDGINNI